jgi:hypothetical protein
MELYPTTGVSGGLFWDLYSHASTHGYSSNDIYMFHYPGDTADVNFSISMVESIQLFWLKGVPLVMK